MLSHEVLIVLSGDQSESSSLAMPPAAELKKMSHWWPSVPLLVSGPAFGVAPHAKPGLAW